jgi:hypothetical protein
MGQIPPLYNGGGIFTSLNIGYRGNGAKRVQNNICPIGISIKIRVFYINEAMRQKEYILIFTQLKSIQWGKIIFAQYQTQ